MSDQFSLLNIGELARPATVLIEKISDALGGCFRPYQIRRIAQAEANAEKIKTIAQIEITDIERRAMERWFGEEAMKQNNIDSVTAKALPQLEDDADPQKVENDWISNFFDRCRLISDDEMQTLWAKILAGEANSPGTYSKRTVNLLGSLDKSDAILFARLCGFAWHCHGIVPLVYDLEAEIYNAQGVNFETMSHLDDIGLVTSSSPTGYQFASLPDKVQLSYYGTPIIVELKKHEHHLDTGRVLLTRTGEELAEICGSEPVPGFLDYVIAKWVKKGHVISSPYPKSGALA